MIFHSKMCSWQTNVKASKLLYEEALNPLSFWEDGPLRLARSPLVPMQKTCQWEAGCSCRSSTEQILN